LSWKIKYRENIRLANKTPEMSSADHYNLLGVHRQASRDDIRAAYKGKALALHPDKNPNGEALFKLVVNAYQTLMSPTKKCVYDRDYDLKESRRPAYGAPPRSSSPSTAGRGAYQHAQPSSRGPAEQAYQSKFTTNEQLFKDAYSQYKTGTNAGYNADAKNTGRKYYEEAQGNFGDWFKKKQDELKVHEEHLRAKADFAKKLEEEEREKADAWRRMQRDRERDREHEMEREKERRRRENEAIRKEQETQQREERNQAAYAKVKEFTEAQKRQQVELERHLSDLSVQKEELRAQKEKLSRERLEVEKSARVDERGKAERQRRRDEDIAEEMRMADAKIRQTREHNVRYEEEQRAVSERRKMEEERAVQEQIERDERQRRDDAAQDAADRARSEERKIQASNIGAQRKKVMDSMMNERKKHEEEVQAMRRETDRIEAEMKAKLEALRAAKREGKQINVEEFRL
jgi:curved DNA-binding protein CbpA